MGRVHLRHPAAPFKLADIEPRSSLAPPCPSYSYVTGVKNLPATACCWATGCLSPRYSRPRRRCVRACATPPEMRKIRAGRVPLAHVPTTAIFPEGRRRPGRQRHAKRATPAASTARPHETPAAWQAAGRLRALPRVATRVGRRTRDGVASMAVRLGTAAARRRRPPARRRADAKCRLTRAGCCQTDRSERPHWWHAGQLSTTQTVAWGGAPPRRAASSLQHRAGQASARGRSAADRGPLASCERRRRLAAHRHPSTHAQTRNRCRGHHGFYGKFSIVVG